jgi:peptidoglycan/xylan/chitin deacetylase (PgdA/CDA1 family)
MIRGWPWARYLFIAAELTVLGALGWRLAGGDVPLTLLALLALALLVAIAGGVFSLGAGLFARPILAVAPALAGDRVALTFDDGPDANETRAVAALLEARGHRATFFVIGKKAASEPVLLAELVARGHGLGNHSFNHSWATPFRHPARLAEELAQAQALLAQAGARVRWFRPPVGLLSPRVAAAAKKIGLTIVGWSASARDGRATTTVEQAAARLVAAARPGAILVLHDAAERGGRAPIAARVLPALLDALAARGLRSVTLDELLDIVSSKSGTRS